MIGNTGEVRRLSLTALGSGTKTELGGVSLATLVVSQPAPAPLRNTLQPGGRAGGVTASKFSDKGNLWLPIRKVKLRSPRSFVPSWSCSVATLVPPQIPVVVKL